MIMCVGVAFGVGEIWRSCNIQNCQRRFDGTDLTRRNDSNYKKIEGRLDVKMRLKATETHLPTHLFWLFLLLLSRNVFVWLFALCFELCVEKIWSHFVFHLIIFRKNFGTWIKARIALIIEDEKTTNKLCNLDE